MFNFIIYKRAHPGVTFMPFSRRKIVWFGWNMHFFRRKRTLGFTWEYWKIYKKKQCRWKSAARLSAHQNIFNFTSFFLLNTHTLTPNEWKVRRITVLKKNYNVRCVEDWCAFDVFMITIMTVFSLLFLSETNEKKKRTAVTIKRIKIAWKNTV